MPLQIAAPPFYCQLFFQGKTEGDGFSESYWVDADDYDAAMNLLVDDQSGLIIKRVALMPDDVTITYARVSDSTELRDTVVEGITADVGDGTYSPPAGATTLPLETAVQVRMQGKVNEKPVFMIRPLRGLTSDVIVKGIYAAPQAWVTAFDDYKEWLIQNAKIVVKSGDSPARVTIDTVLAQRASHRKCGRFFGQSVGRSRL